MRSKQYFTSIKNNPHEISTDPNKYKWNDWEKFLDEFAPICPKTLIKFYSQVKNKELSICLTP